MLSLDTGSTPLLTRQGAVSVVTDPEPRVHPEVIAVMGDAGIGLRAHGRGSSRRSWLPMPRCLSQWVRRPVSSHSGREAGQLAARGLTGKPIKPSERSAARFVLVGRQTGLTNR
jgi:hypothetical protein